MRIYEYTKMLKYLIPAVLLLFAAACSSGRQTEDSRNLQYLLDKAAIEELLVDYYSQLGTGGKGFSDYYVEDSILDVNGRIAQGREEIENLYKMAAQEDSPAVRGRAFRMMLTNMRITIDVNGDSATGDVLWTGVNSRS